LIIIKELPITEISQLALIDRAETVHTVYHVVNKKLVKKNEEFVIPSWSLEDNGSHSVPAKIRGMEPDLKNGTLLGAYVNGTLAGLGSIRYQLTADMAQLLSLHVSKPFRRLRVASALYNELERLAIDSKAKFFYVSACPTGSAVEFYLSKGFQPVESPNPQLFAEEPDDIHMIKTLKKQEVYSVG
jgi:ribosomal protein S18 acetylase RimI-like enzyme